MIFINAIVFIRFTDGAVWKFSVIFLSFWRVCLSWSFQVDSHIKFTRLPRLVFTSLAFKSHFNITYIIRVTHSTPVFHIFETKDVIVSPQAIKVGEIQQPRGLVLAYGDAVTSHCIHLSLCASHFGLLLQQFHSTYRPLVFYTWVSTISLFSLKNSDEIKIKI